MPDNLRHVMLQVVGQLCSQVGFERITETSLHLLTDIMERYLQNLCLYIDKVSRLSDGVASLEDGLFAVKLLGQSPGALIKFIEDVGPYFTPAPASLCGPIHGKVCLNIPPEGHEELTSRPDYIPPHLPLNYCYSEQNDFLADGPPLAILPPESGNPNNHHVSTCIVSGSVTTAPVSSSAVHPSRALPVWAKQVTYRPIRVSIDPVTGSLVEHAPPEKLPDYLYDDDFHTVSSNLPRGTRFDVGRTTSRSPTHLQSSTSRQGATDAEWAAALQATPNPRPSKRIVYTPSRFDPSSLPSYMSSARRSVAKALNTANVRRSPASVMLTAQKARPPPVIRASIPKAKSLSATSGKRRRGSIRRARKWARKSSLSKNPSSLEKVSESPLVRTSPKVDIPSPSVDKTPALRTTDAMESPSRFSIQSEHSLPPQSPASDATPPADSPMGALRMNKIDSADQLAISNVDAKVEPSVDDQLTLQSSPLTKTPTPVVEDELMSSPKPGPVESAAATSTPAPGLPKNPDKNPESCSSIPADNYHKRGRPRAGRRGHGRRVITPRVSIISSLFQNPLRQRAPQSRPQPSKKIPDTRSSDQPTPKELRPHDTQITEKNTPTAQTSIENIKKGRKSTTALSRHGRRPTAPPNSRSKPHSATTVPLASNELESNSRLDISQTSPVSDTTEPMVDEVRARLLQMPENSPVKSRTEPFKGEDQQSTFRTLPFTGHNFAKLRSSSLKASNSLPSSPSSLDSTLSSSSSSLSKEEYPLINERPSIKVEHREGLSGSVEQFVPSVSTGALVEAKQARSTPFSSSPSSSTLTLSTLSSISTAKQHATAHSPVCSSALHPSPTSNCPPPLLPLATSVFDACSQDGLLSGSANSDPCAVIPPPTLVPVSGFGSTVQRFKVSTSTVLPGEHGSKPSSTSSSLLRFKLRHESIEAREILTSSLSPSSSSSSLSSSSSTPIHQDPADRMATVPPHIFTTKSSTISDSGHADLENVPLSNAPSVVDQGSSSTKTPKIVIRLGGGVNPAVLSCTQSPFVRTSEKPVVASPALVDTTPAPLAPPPLRLTISKDRLTYRGNDAAQNDDDSNASSSSSISESLNSSGDEDEDIMVNPDQPKISNLQTSLPPPPLERLPDRTLSATRPPLDASSATRISTRQQFSEQLYKSATPTRDSDKILESRRNDVPPLLPLFSPVVTSAAPFQVGPPSLTTISSAPSHIEVDRPHEGSSVSLQRKRRHPPAKHESLSKRGRLNSPISSLGSRGHGLSGSTRVRVDSVFTDDEESDGNGAAGSAVKRPLSIDTNLPEANPRGSGSVPKQTTPKSQKFFPSPVSTRTVPLDTKRVKGRPRTKHTSTQLTVPSYSPVIKSKSQFAPTRCKARSRMKPESTNAPTCSSPLTKPGLVGSQRPASQVVVASAGNSYYFHLFGAIRRTRSSTMVLSKMCRVFNALSNRV
ncbi:hypothetical protein CRM22_005581 [Opisthorchis felineus]|uniref:Bromodomain associated domain-containing protein n=1 Tax=Opisthorchis felineus TaxID=147828 RepID=A0A4S2LRT9_OPIFE|nr:hypothetical protein CRM22_005581 [Opisthorchis felineus]